MGTLVNDFATGVPPPRLRPYVSTYTGYRIEGAAPGVHMGLPSKSLTFIVAFDEPLDVTTTIEHEQRDRYWAMLAGLHASPALVRHDGRQHGVQLDVTPRGAGALFGVPAAELGSTAVHLQTVVPRFAAELIERLSEAGGWAERWTTLDAVLLRELNVEAEIPSELEHAWALLVAGRGLAQVGDVADRVGWSRSHLTQRFAAQYGLTPKVMSRVLRFEHAKGLLQAPTRPSLASVAAVSYTHLTLPTTYPV